VLFAHCASLRVNAVHEPWIAQAQKPGHRPPPRYSPATTAHPVPMFRCRHIGDVHADHHRSQVAKPKSGFQVTEADTLELLQRNFRPSLKTCLPHGMTASMFSNEPVEHPLSLIAHAASRVTVTCILRG
jgi:hypothetical protein